MAECITIYYSRYPYPVFDGSRGDNEHHWVGDLEPHPDSDRVCTSWLCVFHEGGA